MEQTPENADQGAAQGADAPVDTASTTGLVNTSTEADTGSGEAVDTVQGTDTPTTSSEAVQTAPTGQSATIRVAPPVVSDPDFKGRRFTVYSMHGAVVYEAETHDAQVGVALSPGQYHVYVNNVDEADEERFGKPVNKVIEITGEGVEDFLIE